MEKKAEKQQKMSKIKQKSSKKMTRKILGLILLGVLMAIAVGAGLVQLNRHLALMRGVELAERILEYEEPMRKYFIERAAEDFGDAEKVENLADEGKKLYEIIELSNEIREDDVVCADERLTICDALGVDTAKLSMALARSEALLAWRESGEILTEDSGIFGDGKMAEVIKKLADLKAKIAEFKEKYPTGADFDEKVMLTEYGEIFEQIEALEKEAEAMKFEEIYGASQEELLNIFKTVEALKNKLN